jgi:hypothetical protein
MLHKHSCHDDDVELWFSWIHVILNEEFSESLRVVEAELVGVRRAVDGSSITSLHLLDACQRTPSLFIFLQK